MSGATVAPFRALRYSADRVGDLGAVWAPPYDVITPEGAGELRRRHPHNIVRITNPEGEAPERYAAAALLLQNWVADGWLVREPRPAVYVHRHEFGSGGAARARTGLWALLALTPFDAGIVLPHERTMRGPKADRLALMRACGAQLSPVFFICSDPLGDVRRGLDELGAGTPTEAAEFPAGERHAIWRIAADGSEREAVASLIAALGEQVLLIADGHHRYETGLAFRDELIGGGAPSGGRHAHEFVLAYLVPESDPGLELWPTHRVIRGEPLDWADALERVRDRFDVQAIDAAGLASASQLLERERGRPTFVLAADSSMGRVLRLRKPDRLTAISSVAFHEVFLAAALGLALDDQIGRMSYLHDASAALAEVRASRAEAAALLAPPQVAQVREAAAAGARLPPKTTYFWPKVPTGVAVHLTDLGEEVARSPS